MQTLKKACLSMITQDFQELLNYPSSLATFLTWCSASCWISSKYLLP